MIKYDARIEVFRKGFGKISFVVCKSGRGLVQFEIPNNYEMFHVENILRDYRNDERTLALKTLDKDVVTKYMNYMRNQLS